MNLDPHTKILIHSGKRTRIECKLCSLAVRMRHQVLRDPAFSRRARKANHLKRITSLIGITALSFITSAPAQEEETASPTPDEKPSTTIEETPTPAPEAKITATPTEQPAAQKKGKPAAPGPGKPTSTGPGGREENERARSEG
jgi:uncharacterized membrane protein